MVWFKSIAYLGAAIAPVLLAWLWARNAHSPKVRTWLLRSSIACGVTLCGAWLVGLAIVAACNGNWLYGYRDCFYLPDNTANAVFAFTVLSFVVVMVFLVVTFIGCAIAEWRVRNSRSE